MKLSAWYAMNHSEELEHGARLNKYGIIEYDHKEASPSTTSTKKSSSYKLYRVSAYDQPSGEDTYYKREVGSLGQLGAYEKISYEDYKKLLKEGDHVTVKLKIDPITGKAPARLDSTSGKEKRVAYGSTNRRNS